MAKEPNDGDHVRMGVEGYWSHVKHPWFVAFFELAVAARTDKELAEILFPAQEAFEREWYEASLELFPEWKRKGEKFVLGFDLSRYVMEGMAIGFLTHKETERDKRVLRYLEEKLRNSRAKIASRYRTSSRAMCRSISPSTQAISAAPAIVEGYCPDAQRMPSRPRIARRPSKCAACCGS